MDSSDDKLVEKILQGDTEVFASLVERYKVVIYNLMYRYSGSQEDASDMTQEVFCRIYERLDRYRRKKSFFSWMYAIALNYAKDWARKKSRGKRWLGLFIQEELQEPVEQVEERLICSQEAESLKNALDILAGDNREMVILKYRHEYTIKEIAEIFNLSESAVKMRIHRSLQELGTFLNKVN